MSFNVSLCNRCKIKEAEVRCDDCLQGGVYCANCDGYLHSMPSKVHHTRIPLTQQKAQTAPSPSNPPSVTQGYIGEIKKIYEAEKLNLQSTIAQLSNELVSTQKTLNERVTFLHMHLEEANRNHLAEIDSINKSHMEEMNKALGEKENEISRLVYELNEERKHNEELIQKIKEYEKVMDINSISYNTQIDQLNANIENLNKENESLEIFYQNKIDEINAMHQNEKNKIITSYEMAIEKMNQGYIQSKEKYNGVIQQRENDIKEMANEHKKEIDDLNSVIDKLKEVNATSKNDQEELIKMNDTLKEALESVNTELSTYKKNLKKTEKDNKKLESTIQSLTEENSQLKASNDKLNGIVYGKFNRTKQN